MTFSEQIVYGCFRPAKYKEMLELPRKRFVLYVIVMMLVLGIVGFVLPTASVISRFGGFEQLFETSLGEVRFQNERLSVANQYNFQINYANLLIDTTQETVANESLTKQGMFIAVGSKTVRVSAVVGSKVTDYGVYYLSDYLMDGFSNESLLAMIPSIYMALFFSLLGVMISYFIKYAVVALVFSILVNGMNKQFHLGLSFGQVFVLCFYGQSFAMILSNFNAFVSFLPSMLVSIIGIFVTVHMITMSVALMKNEKEL